MNFSGIQYIYMYILVFSKLFSNYKSKEQLIAYITMYMYIHIPQKRHLIFSVKLNVYVRSCKFQSMMISKYVHKTHIQ